MAPATHGTQGPGHPAGRFGGDRRLRRRAEFQRVFDTGRRVQGRYVTVIALANGSPVTRLGIVASRRLGNAVHRNRAKRRVREIFRRMPTDGAGLDLVVIPRRELLDAPYSTVEADFVAAVRRCGCRVPRHARP